MSKITIDHADSSFAGKIARDAFIDLARQAGFKIKRFAGPNGEFPVAQMSSGHFVDIGSELATFAKLVIAALKLPQAEQGPIRWPANASEVRAFLSGHVAAERYARDDHQPDDSDTYTLSAHDLLGAIDWWTDFAQRPQQPLPPQSDIPLTQEQLTVFKYGWKCAESAHGIGGEA